MNELRIFNDAQFGNIRAMMIDGKPWFIAIDVARILAYKNCSRDINTHVAEKHRTRITLSKYQNGTLKNADVVIYDGRQNRKMIIIDEAGLYSLVLRSKLPRAEAFQEWVVSEVLPSIRNTGGYSTKPVERGKNDLNTKALAKALAAELKRQEMRALPPAGRYITIRTDDAVKRNYIESVVAAMEVLPAGYCSCVESFARGLLG